MSLHHVWIIYNFSIQEVRPLAVGYGGIYLLNFAINDIQDAPTPQGAQGNLVGLKSPEVLFIFG